jgi:hypothetical protein
MKLNPPCIENKRAMPYAHISRPPPGKKKVWGRRPGKGGKRLILTIKIFETQKRHIRVKRHAIPLRLGDNSILDISSMNFSVGTLDNREPPSTGTLGKPARQWHARDPPWTQIHNPPRRDLGGGGVNQFSDRRASLKATPRWIRQSTYVWWDVWPASSSDDDVAESEPSVEVSSAFESGASTENLMANFLNHSWQDRTAQSVNATTHTKTQKPLRSCAAAQRRFATAAILRADA